MALEFPVQIQLFPALQKEVLKLGDYIQNKCNYLQQLVASFICPEEIKWLRLSAN